MAEQVFPEPTVGVFIFNQAGEILLLKSHKWPGKYVVPGGHVELGERLEEAAVREAKEETGLDIYDRREVRRDLLVLASDLQPGDSGSAVVRSDGTVIAVAVAIAPDRDGVAYALDRSELDALLARPRGATVDTGECVS